MKALLHHLSYELKSGFRDKSRLLMNYLFPLAITVLMGSLMGQINPFFSERMIPAMALFALMSSAFLLLPPSIVANRANGVFRSFKINAVPRAAIVGVPIMAMAINGIIVTCLVIVLCAVAFGASLPQDPLRFALVWLACFMAIAALGNLIGTLARNERAAVLIAQAFFVPSILLGGLMMPESILPDGLKALSLAFPATHAMRAFMDPSQFVLSLGVLGSIAALSLAISVKGFRWIPR